MSITPSMARSLKLVEIARRLLDSGDEVTRIFAQRVIDFNDSIELAKYESPPKERRI